MQTIRLYLGAHKTATTHLQGILIANRDLLAERGVCLSAPQDIRKEWLPLFFKAVKALHKEGCIPDTLAEPLVAQRPAHGDWILTEENIVGIPVDLLHLPGLYPNAAKRLRTLVTLFPKARISLHFSLRSYDSFYRSMYSEIVRSRRFVPFDAFYDETAFAQRTWHDTVARFAEVLPQGDIILWRFEDFRALMPDLLRQITGQDDVDDMIAHYAPTTTRSSLSQRAIDLITDLAPAVGPETALRLTEQINAHYGVDKGYAPFEPFAPSVAERLQAQYAADLAQIRQRFPGIRCLTPDPAALPRLDKAG